MQRWPASEERPDTNIAFPATWAVCVCVCVCACVCVYVCVGASPSLATAMYTSTCPRGGLVFEAH